MQFSSSINYPSCATFEEFHIVSCLFHVSGAYTSIYLDVYLKNYYLQFIFYFICPNSGTAATEPLQISKGQYSVSESKHRNKAQGKGCPWHLVQLCLTLGHGAHLRFQAIERAFCSLYDGHGHVASTTGESEELDKQA